MQRQRTSRQNNTIHQLFTLVLAIYLFNFSIDPKDTTPAYLAEDLSLNDIESVVELLTEELLGLEDLIDETDEADMGDERVNISAIYFFHQYTCITLQVPTGAALPYQEANVQSSYAFKPDVASPPPKLF